jgi:DNA-binding MurR/RpiR family transcriptional regulator
MPNKVLHKKLSESDLTDIKNLPKPLTNKYIAEQYKVSTSTICKIRSRSGYGNPRTVRQSSSDGGRGEKHYKTKLTESDVLEIRSESEYYGVITSLAKRHEVSPSTIIRIRKGKGWKHLL